MNLLYYLLYFCTFNQIIFCLSFLKKASLAAGPLLITEHRQKVVDFTEPFMRMRATLLLRKSILNAGSLTSLRDVLGRPDLKIGTLEKGILLRALKNGNTTLLRTLWRSIRESKPSTFTSSNEEGIERVRTENYAFILPDTIAEYVALRACDLVTVDKFLVDEGYAMALPLSSPWKYPIDNALGTLRKTGYLDKLYHKWWTRNSSCETIYPNKMPRIYSSTNAGARTCDWTLWTRHVLYLAVFFVRYLTTRD